MSNTNNGITVLSLFDGISCGQVALQRAGIKVAKYYASEIDKSAIAVTQANWPNTIQLGSVTDVQGSALPQIDLLIGGSPCQGFSFAGKQLNFEDPRSKLFFEYVRLLEECKPKWFLLENVIMKAESCKVISERLGVEPIKIDSSLVSAQSRKRLYWTNIPNVAAPEDKNIKLQDILEGGFALRDKAYCLCASANPSNRPSYKKRFLTKAMGNCKSIDGTKNVESLTILTVKEEERLQTLPDGYTASISDLKRHHAIGNGWTVDVIAHIFKSLPPQT